METRLCVEGKNKYAMKGKKFSLSWMHQASIIIMGKYTLEEKKRNLEKFFIIEPLVKFPEDWKVHLQAGRIWVSYSVVLGKKGERGDGWEIQGAP